MLPQIIHFSEKLAEMKGYNKSEFEVIKSDFMKHYFFHYGIRANYLNIVELAKISFASTDDWVKIIQYLSALLDSRSEEDGYNEIKELVSNMTEAYEGFISEEDNILYVIVKDNEPSFETDYEVIEDEIDGGYIRDAVIWKVDSTGGTAIGSIYVSKSGTLSNFDYRDLDLKIPKGAIGIDRHPYEAGDIVEVDDVLYCIMDTMTDSKDINLYGVKLTKDETAVEEAWVNMYRITNYYGNILTLLPYSDFQNVCKDTIRGALIFYSYR